MNVALKRALSAVDLNFNPPSFPLAQLRDCAREFWGLEGELTPLDGERDQNHRLTTADGTSYVLKVSAAGESRRRRRFPGRGAAASGASRPGPAGAARHRVDERQ